MHKNIIFLVIGFLFNNNIYSQNSENDTLRVEAKKFTLELIETYFNNDCELFFSNLSDSIIILKGKGIVEKKKFKEKICESYSKAILDTTKVFKDYIDNYSLQVLSKTELISLFGNILPNYYKP